MFQTSLILARRVCDESRVVLEGCLQSRETEHIG